MLVIDNYDSFTYNLVQYLLAINVEVIILRNDECSEDRIEHIKPTHILISPGSGNPDTAGKCLEIVEKYAGIIPIMGVCLGHQIIAQSFGARIVKAREPMHGKVSSINHRGNGLFQGIPSPIRVTRYHSLIVEQDSLPPCFEVSAVTEEGDIMALSHKNYKLESVQFHPESILTEYGLDMLRNFFH